MAPKLIYAFAFLGVFSLSLAFLAGHRLHRKPAEGQIHKLLQEIQSSNPTTSLTKMQEAHYSFVVDAEQTKQIKLYKQLQQEIAKRIPTEYDRPIIELKIHFNKTNKNSAKTIGILGGIGPLSDASIVEKLVKHIEPFSIKQNLSIHLLSMPPPRSTWEMLTGGISYIKKLYEFASLDYSQFFMASNTAHMHYEKFAKLTSAKAFNLPDTVIEKLKQQNPNGTSLNVLILDTQKAYRNKLYQKKLLKWGIKHVDLSASHRQNLEHWIKKTKIGQVTSHDSFQFYQFIAALSSHYNAGAIILACTEIPLALSIHVSKLRERGILVLDSESILVDAIASYLARPIKKEEDNN